MSKHVEAGEKAEEQFVIELNDDKKDSRWQTLGIKNAEEHFAVLVSVYHYSKFSEQKVQPKADVFIASGTVTPQQLKQCKFLLKEDALKDLCLVPVPCTGISIKKYDSASYTIHKWPPDSFKKKFVDYELGAGIELFVENHEEFDKNDRVISEWKTSWAKIEDYFSSIDNIKVLKDKEADPDVRKKVGKEVKKLSKEKVYGMIKSNADIIDHIFYGSNDFDEPYNATWLFTYGKLERMQSGAAPVPFRIDQGSGRTKGKYTVVIKPKIKKVRRK